MYRMIRASVSDKTLKRVASYKEFDNGHVLFEYKKMTFDEAEEAARLASIKDPDNIYYVKYDDIMDSASDVRWIAGKKYDWSQVQMKGDKPYIKSSTEVKSAFSKSEKEVCLRVLKQMKREETCKGILDQIDQVSRSLKSIQIAE